MSPTRAFYLGHGDESLYALFDDAAASGARVGVLLCPLFGNEDLCAYRARREWAKTLAAAGHPTLRFDLPGSGDSAGGPHDPGRLDAWIKALSTAGAWLRAEADCARVVAIGIGLGGLLCCSATAGGVAIDDLVLWSVPVRGRALVRQLRALSRMEASRDTTELAADDDAAPVTQAPQVPHQGLASAGFAMSAETVAALEALDLTELELPDAHLRRVLMLERDGLKVDRRLRAALEQSGAEVTIAPGPGYGAMVAPPQQSQPPTEVFAAVGKWLADSRAEALRPAPSAPATTTTLELEVKDAYIRETPIAIEHNAGRLVGVLAEPSDGVQLTEPSDEARPTEPSDTTRLCAVMLNAGALRHIGPNRMWVEIARRWAARGVPTLRIDLAGIGDADGDASVLEHDESFYVPHYVEQTHAVLEALAAYELPQRFVLCGLCSGAYWAFQVALEDERVRGAMMINPRALFWDASIDAVRDARNARKMLHPRTWQKLLRGEIERERVGTIARGVGVTLASLPARARANRRARVGGVDQLDRALERLDSTGAQLLGIFTAGEPVLEELARDGGLRRARSHSNVRVESIPGPLTSHTLEPLQLQRATHALVDEALDRLLDPHPSNEGETTRKTPCLPGQDSQHRSL